MKSMILYPDENFINHFKIFITILESYIESQYGTSLLLKQYENIENINKIIINLDGIKPIFSILTENYYIDIEKFKQLFYINNIRYILLPKIKFVHEIIKIDRISESFKTIKILYKNEECVIEKIYEYDIKYIYKGNIEINHDLFITIKQDKNSINKHKIYYVNTPDKNLLLI